MATKLQNRYALPQTLQAHARTHTEQNCQATPHTHSNLPSEHTHRAKLPSEDTHTPKAIFQASPPSPQKKLPTKLKMCSCPSENEFRDGTQERSVWCLPCAGISKSISSATYILIQLRRYSDAHICLLRSELWPNSFNGLPESKCARTCSHYQPMVHLN